VSPSRPGSQGVPAMWQDDERATEVSRLKKTSNFYQGARSEWANLVNFSGRSETGRKFRKVPRGTTR
jgi:hypothetical protein